MTIATNLMLKDEPNEVKELFEMAYEKYIKKGWEPDFHTEQLKEYWFYIKVNNLCYEINHGTKNFEMACKLLKREMALNSAKIANPSALVKTEFNGER